MEKSKYTPRSTLHNLAKILLFTSLIFIGSLVVLAILGPIIGSMLFVHQETLTIPLQPGTVVTSETNFQGYGGFVRLYDVIPDGTDNTRFDLQQTLFFDRRVVTLDFDYLEINGQPASEVLSLAYTRGYDAEKNIYEIGYSIPMDGEEPIQVRVLDGFASDPHGGLRMTFWYSTFPVYGCVGQDCM